MNLIRTKLNKFIVDNFLYGRGSLADDDSLLQKEVIDSTGVLELVGFLEKEYGIRVNDEDLVPANLDSINNLVGFLERKLAVPEGAA